MNWIILSLMLLIMTISATSWSADDRVGFKKQKENKSLVYYSGAVIVEGKFTYSNSKLNQEIIGDQLCFHPTQKDGALIPRDNDKRAPWFCFKDSKRAKDLLGISKLLKDPTVCSISGIATVEISNYVVDRAETDTNDVTDLVKVIKKSEPITRPYFKNGQECE
jgi:hypothetical protein